MLRSTARQSQVLSSYAMSWLTTILPRITKPHATFKWTRSSLSSRLLLIVWDSVDLVRLLNATAANPRLIPLTLHRHQQRISPQQPKFHAYRLTVFRKFGTIYKHLILLAVSVEMVMESQSVAHANYLLRKRWLALKFRHGHSRDTILIPSPLNLL